MLHVALIFYVKKYAWVYDKLEPLTNVSVKLCLSKYVPVILLKIGISLSDKIKSGQEL